MGYIMLEYLCPECGERLESLEERKAPAASVPHCGTQAPRTLSAVMGRMKMGEVTRGENGPKPPNALSTEALADGMRRTEWDKSRRDKIKKARTDYIKRNI